MGTLNDGMDGAEELPVSESADWIDRVTHAASDFESVAPEIAAELGL